MRKIELSDIGAALIIAGSCGVIAIIWAIAYKIAT